MSVYLISVYVHIVGALGLFAALGLEWALLTNLRRASTSLQVREWLGLSAGIRRLGGLAALALLVTGIYMSTVAWGRQPWIGLGLLGLLLMAGLGRTLSGTRIGAMARILSPDDGPLTAAMHGRLRDPVLLLSAWIRTALGLGIVFIMSAKPGPGIALSTVLIALALGLVAGARAWSGQRGAALSGAPFTNR